jgi:hypothetical protein
MDIIISCDCGGHQLDRILELAGLIFESVDYDLQSKYDKFNNLYFEGKLPRIPMVFKPLKQVGGQVLGKSWRGELVPDSMRMEISSTFKKSEAALDGLLLHEMIHVYFFATGHLKENHGGKFLRMRRELTEKSGINIPLTDSTAGLETTEEVKIKPYGVILVEKDGSPSYAIVSEKFMLENSDALKKRWESMYRTYPVSAYIVTSEIVSTMALRNTVQRSIKLSYYFLKDAAILDNIKSGKLIWKMDGK